MKTLNANGYTDLNKIKIIGVVNGKLYIIDENERHLHLSLTGEHSPIILTQEEVVEYSDQVNTDMLDPNEKEVSDKIIKDIIKPVGNPQRGWALMQNFIDDEGNVFCKGKYQHTLLDL